MEQHPMPRQITTFEFKLIGFLTLKQFIYLVLFIPLGFIAYKLIAIPLLNILIAALVAGLGVAFAFVPINDRPLDVWIKNLTKRLTSATPIMSWRTLSHKKNWQLTWRKPNLTQPSPTSKNKQSQYFCKNQKQSWL